MTPQTSGNLIEKPPVITIMGHVDHGKTTLLDYIRKTKIAEKEVGGITQKIGAYQVEIKDKKITFIDTPGHAAFAKMRAMGEKVADIVVIVIAAGEGVMPQTLEAIDLAKSSKTPYIIAFNKMDLPGADINKVKKQLADNNILVEGWGGDVSCAEISAKTGNGVDALLDLILLVAEIMELKANTAEPFYGVVIESGKDPKKGAVCTVIAKTGKLSVSDMAYSQDGQKTKIKALMDFRGKRVKKILPGEPMEVLGFTKPVKLGAVISADPNFFKSESFAQMGKTASAKEIKSGGKTLNIIIKADTRGSLDAIRSTLLALKKEDTFINILQEGVGPVSESDVLFAISSRAVILGLSVPVPRNVLDMAKSAKVIIRTYKIIYRLFEDIEGALDGLLELAEEKIKGRGEVIAKFKLPKSGDIVAGCKVLAGRLKVKDKVCVWESLEDLKKSKEVKEDGELKPLYSGSIKNLKIGRNEVNVAGKDNETGVFLFPQFPAIKVGFILEIL
ncbi:MAG: translation initiation factor IF-2 [Patescibacteria group bacterium]